MRTSASAPLAFLLLAACPIDHSTTTLSSLSSLPPAGFEGGDDCDGDPTDPTVDASTTSGDTGVLATEPAPTGSSSQAATDEAGLSTTGPGLNPTTTAPDATSATGGSSSACSDYMRTVESIRPSVVLVIDRSGSMTADPGGYWDHDQNPGTPEVTHWRSLHDVIADIVATHGGAHDFGAALSPSNAAHATYSVAACPVSHPLDVPIDSDNAANILAVLPPADGSTIKGASPTAAAVVAATAELLARPSDVPRHIVLVADSPPNCHAGAPDGGSLFEAYDSDVELVVAEASTHGITTHVIGIEASDVATPSIKDGTPDNVVVADILDTLAALGGSEAFHNTFDQIQLQDVFESILSHTHACTVQLDAVPEYPLELTISIDDQLVPHVDGCGDEPGWAWVDAYTIAFCGSACDDFNAHGEARFDALCG